MNIWSGTAPHRTENPGTFPYERSEFGISAPSQEMETGNGVEQQWLQ